LILRDIGRREATGQIDGGELLDAVTCWKKIPKGEEQCKEFIIELG